LAKTMLEVKDLEVYYDSIHAIKGVNFSVDEGEIVTLIGANGAGKTTILHTVSGLVRPRSGEIRFCDTNLIATKPYRIPVLGLSQVPEGRRVFSRMTVKENLFMGAFTRKDEKIRDAVTFQEEASDANNHFVKLIINGEKRESNGLGSGANPRTAIGQREDGTVLMLVTDGRGSAGHLGATANDLIEIMEDYGAVNAANIDGGSSSTMYYEDKYLMTSVTLYYSNSSWRLPEAFIVSK